MREELEDARAIQLAMLPSSAPEMGWLELQGMSLPATEVGGDYYDFLKVDEDRIAVVVGDVAGHGVASGLLLSGVRAGLHLLRGDLGESARGRRAAESAGARQRRLPPVHEPGGRPLRSRRAARSGW